MTPRTLPLLVALAFASACSDASLSTVDPGIPPEVVQYADDWPLPGRDYQNSRATTDSPIDASNVASLEVAWSLPMPGRGAYGNVSTAPIIAGDAIYLEDLSNTGRAVHRDTGTVTWPKTYP